MYSITQIYIFCIEQPFPAQCQLCCVGVGPGHRVGWAALAQGSVLCLVILWPSLAVALK